MNKFFIGSFFGVSFRAYSNSRVEILFINQIKPDKIINMMPHTPVILEVPLICELFNVNKNMKAAKIYPFLFTTEY
jgi:hypothetical protein